MKLLRITMSGVEGLVNVDTEKLRLVGDSSIRCSGWNDYILKMKTPTGVAKINTARVISGSDRQSFLEYIDEFLKTRGWYLTNANYHPRKGFSQHKLTGILHWGQEQQDS